MKRELRPFGLFCFVMLYTPTRSSVYIILGYGNGDIRDVEGFVPWT